MAHLLGRDWTKRELLERVGDLSQIAGVERFTYDEGVAAGVKAVRVRTGGGLDFTILLSRGMDIGQASFNGLPLAWASATGAAHPQFFEPEGREGRGWLRTFHGGLLTGCGFLNAGAANRDGDELLSLHGYLSHTPAEETYAGVEWDGDEAEIVVQGIVREARVFGENLRLTRRITAKLGGNTLKVEDTVENRGFQEMPLMLLYHLNFGWPLVSEQSEILFTAAGPTEPRDADAREGLDRWNRLDAPTRGYAEQCFFHEPKTNPDGTATVLMLNRSQQFGARIDYDKSTLPWLTEWKMMGQGDYVCGIEPANCRVFGRAKEREAGRLQHIAPGETRRFTVSISALGDAAAISEAEGALPRA